MADLQRTTQTDGGARTGMTPEGDQGPHNEGAEFGTSDAGTRGTNRDADDSGRAAGSVDRDGVAHDGACVRACRADARRPPLRCDEQHRFPGPNRSLGGRRERAAVAEVLAVEGDHPCRVVGGERGDELRRLEVGLVSE